MKHCPLGFFLPGDYNKIMKIVLAPNEFKESLDVFRVVEVFRKGVEEVFPSARVEEVPIADGGDGTLEVFKFNLGGEKVYFRIRDPLLSGWHEAPVLFLGDLAIVEVASSSGLKLVPRSRRNPLHTSSYGTGELILRALERGVKEIWLAVGGSSTVDGALGILSALGCKFLDDHGTPLSPVGASLPVVRSVELSPLCRRFPAKIRILTDVRSGLLDGVRLFAPQKGADPEDVELLEMGMVNWAGVTAKITGRDPALVEGGGAAGGIPAFLSAYLNAGIERGAEFVIEKVGLVERMKGAELLISGEGKIDSTTLEGKAPYVASKMAKNEGLNVIWIGGSVEFSSDLYRVADIVYPAVTTPMDIASAISRAEELVEMAVVSSLLIYGKVSGRL